LTVTPQADLETREILMAVYPKVIQSRTGATFGSATFKDAEERGTKSFLRVKDGQTIILGGLLRNDDANTITKVPFLGDIPFLGAAFKHKNKAGTRRELIIFLTPHILDDQYPYDAQFKEKNAHFRWDEINKTIDELKIKKNNTLCHVPD
jgi:type II secretory pathway component GspD/PulD (secretin)